MPRAPRPLVPAGLYHVTARGNRRQRIFLDDNDCERFVDLLGAATARSGWRCLLYCLMPNHFHAAFETPEPNLSRGMQWLLSRYAERFNRRHGLGGHLFQGRFHSALLERTLHLLELTRYVALNPVRVGLCGDPAEWRWSSYRGLVGLDRSPEFLAADALLALFAEDGTAARRRYAGFVRDGI
jgi:REP element-mobilizing transposase RayT